MKGKKIVVEAIYDRRSIRNYKTQEVPKELLLEYWIPEGPSHPGKQTSLEINSVWRKTKGRMPEGNDTF